MTQKYLPFAACLVVAAALLGAGCGNTDTPTTPTEPTTSIPATTTLSTTSGSNATPTDAPSTTIPVVTTPSTSSPSELNDSSYLDLNTTGWETYTNKTLGYTFKYPLRGRYAPEFTIKTLPETSADIQNDCVKPSGLPNATEERLTVNGAPFCRTRSVEAAAGSLYNQEQWVTKKDKWYSVITFTKKYANDPAQAFDTTAYRIQLEEIMSTFTYPTL